MAVEFVNLYKQQEKSIQAILYGKKHHQPLELLKQAICIKSDPELNSL